MKRRRLTGICLRQDVLNLYQTKHQSERTTETDEGRKRKRRTFSTWTTNGSTLAALLFQFICQNAFDDDEQPFLGVFFFRFCLFHNESSSAQTMSKKCLYSLHYIFWFFYLCIFIVIFHWLLLSLATYNYANGERRIGQKHQFSVSGDI